MQAILKITFSIEGYYLAKEKLGRFPTIADYKSQSLSQSTEVNQKIADAHTNGYILPEVFAEDQLVLNESEGTVDLFIRWEDKAALEEHMAWRSTTSTISPFVSYEIIDIV